MVSLDFQIRSSRKEIFVENAGSVDVAGGRLTTTAIGIAAKANSHAQKSPQCCCKSGLKMT
jgi:hypothetical protein